MKTYTAHFEMPSEAVTALIDWSAESGNTLERINGEWVPLEEYSFESLSGTTVATMNEDFVPVFDEADEEQETLYRWELADYIVEDSETE